MGCDVPHVANVHLTPRQEKSVTKSDKWEKNNLSFGEKMSNHTKNSIHVICKMMLGNVPMAQTTSLNVYATNVKILIQGQNTCNIIYTLLILKILYV